MSASVDQQEALQDIPLPTRTAANAFSEAVTTIDLTDDLIGFKRNTHQSSAASLPRHLLIVDQSGQLGGGELALLPLLRAWAQRCELVIFSDGPFRARAEQLGVSVSLLSEPKVAVIRKKWSSFSALFAVGAMYRQIKTLAVKARSADVVYLNSQKALVLGALACAYSKTPVVWHVHDIMSAAHFGPLQRLLVRFIARRYVDRVIANSDASSKSVQSLTGLPASVITVLHNGISSVPFESIEPAQSGRLRQSLGIAPDNLVVGLFGRLTPWKGTHVALKAVAMMPKIHLVIVGKALFGEHEYEASLIELVETMGISDRVHFLGFRDDIPALMKAVDVVLHASIAPEPFGRVIVEGMLARRPVIATAAGGVLEILSHRTNGLLIPLNDAYAIADALSSLASSPNWARQLAQRAFDEASTRFSEKRYVDAVSFVLDNAKP